MIPSVPKHVALLIHSLSGFSERRTMEEAFGWPLTPHRLTAPPCDLALPPVGSQPVFRWWGIYLDYPSWTFNLTLEFPNRDYLVEMCITHHRWKRIGELRWVERMPQDILSRDPIRLSYYCYISQVCSDLGPPVYRRFLLNSYVGSEVLFETWDLYDPRNDAHEFESPVKLMSSQTRRGTRRGEWT